jgi:predicted RNA-binding protein with PIN domain
MPILVDGDNLLGTWRGGRRTDSERRQLAMEISRLARRGDRRIVVVFDGPAPHSSRFGSDVIFAGSHSADDVFLARIKQERDPRDWTVITSDRSLGDRCRWLGARVERSQSFRGRLRPSSGGEKPERETDVEDWLREFGEE